MYPWNKSRKEQSDQASNHGAAVSGLEKVGPESISVLWPLLQGPCHRVLGSLHALSQNWSQSPERAGLTRRKKKGKEGEEEGRRTVFMGSERLGIQQLLISLPVGRLCFTPSWTFLCLTSYLTWAFQSHSFFPELQPNLY